MKLKMSSNRSKVMAWAVCTVALGKAAIAGAGVGLAALGITVDGVAPLFGDYLSQEQVLSFAAIGGGVLGMIAEIFFRS